jgi:hypothetical protein
MGYSLLRGKPPAFWFWYKMTFEPVWKQHRPEMVILASAVESGFLRSTLDLRVTKMVVRESGSLDAWKMLEVVKYGSFVCRSLPLSTMGISSISNFWSLAQLQ